MNWCESNGLQKRVSRIKYVQPVVVCFSPRLNLHWEFTEDNINQSNEAAECLSWTHWFSSACREFLNT